jgi:hypothetical protein
MRPPAIVLRLAMGHRAALTNESAFRAGKKPLHEAEK